MLTLALETSARIPSAALLDGPTLIDRTGPLPAATASASFPLAVDRLVRGNGLRPGQVQLVVATTGPGSFTGLRVGITLARTWCWVTGSLLVGVPTAAVVAAGVQRTLETGGARLLRVLIDAQRGQFHQQTWNLAKPDAAPDACQIVDQSGIAAGLAAGDLLVCAGAFALRTARREGDPTPDERQWPRVVLFPPDPFDAGLMGQRRLQANGPVSPLELLPDYGRPSAAEEKLRPLT